MKKSILFAGGLAASLSLAIWGIGQFNDKQPNPLSQVKMKVLETNPATYEAGDKAKFAQKGQTPEEIRQASREAKKERRLNGYTKPKMDGMDIYAKIHQEIRTRNGEEAPGYKPSQLLNEVKSLQARKALSRREGVEWTSRGPANVPGRAKYVLVLDSDATHNTWLIGTAGGGIWKTTDAGSTWEDKTSNLPSLSISSIVESNGVIYAGTGEYVGGSIGVNGMGIAKSTDDGETWEMMESTLDQEMFRNVNRIVVDPNDANTLVVATMGYNRNRVRSSLDYYTWILRSTDGGATWSTSYESPGVVRQIVAQEDNFNMQYAAMDGVGVLKSTDGGVSWEGASVGMRALTGRIELSISPSNPNRIFAGAEGDASGGDADLYVSDDGAATWGLALEDGAGANIDFYGGQGWYDNAVEAHPYNENIVYVGGVNNWKMELTANSSTALAFGTFENGTEAFMSYINFGGTHLNGGMDVNPDLPSSDFLPVEIRFGSGLSQMAHRFTVSGQGPGVPVADYLYQDYVEVPFEAWDMANNRQLMVSFRDQQEDGAWNLIPSYTEAGDEANHSREYFYIHATPYADTPDASIAVNGGHEHQQMYFYWPVLAEDATFDPAALPESNLEVTVDEVEARTKITTNLSDAYGQYGGKNDGTAADIITNEGPHPDQHFYAVIREDESAETFRILVVNDGGIYKTLVGTDPGNAEGDWIFAGTGMITAQYHGVDKKPGEQRYIGGMQDNNTYLSPDKENASDETVYSAQFGGDGFDVIWNNRDADLIMGGSQFNNFARTTDGGATWVGGTNGLGDRGQGAGPFYSPLANSRSNPDVVFTLGATGVWKSSDFGANWKLAGMDDITLWNGLSGIPQVKVSSAYGPHVWAGSRLEEDTRIYVSTDEGESFTPTANYDKMEMGRISGFATHPTEPNTAYALFAFADAPKILRTTDLGQTWEDITGFENGEDVSTNGYPDAATYDLLVMPHDPNIMWAGTEIGIIESTDAGATWHPLSDDLSAVAVFDMKIQDQEVIIGTHGRGIWTTEIPELPNPQIIASPVLASLGYNVNTEIVVATISSTTAFDSLVLYMDGVRLGGVESPADVSISIENVPAPGVYQFQAIGYINNGLEYKTPVKELSLSDPNDLATSYFNDFNTSSDDFEGTGFSIKEEEGFDNPAIHSDHDYVELTDYIYQLKTPIVIAESNALFRYKDVVVVEPGEPGTVFGDAEFWDYVIVEGSTDGSSWQPLVDGYDSDADSQWRSLYDAEAAGTSEHYRLQTIDLSNTYASGDVVYFRFRLFSDPGAIAWGWAIDDVSIQYNQAPVAGDDMYTPPVGATSVTANLLANDMDPEGEAISITTTPITSPSHGTVVINADGGMVYTPANNEFTEATDMFTYQICDNSFDSKCDTATVTIDGSIALSFEDEIAANRVAVRAFPNPASSTTKVEYFLPQSGQVRVSLHTVDGKLVQSLVDANKGSGLQQMSLPVSNLAKGLYLIKLETGNKATVARLLVK